ncbi:MAG: hypothetical protein J7L38_02290 [Thermoproteales archaeon]|nr:hypothetical protein [Thermoproteales archaeon]
MERSERDSKYLWKTVMLLLYTFLLQGWLAYTTVNNALIDVVGYESPIKITYNNITLNQSGRVFHGEIRVLGSNVKKVSLTGNLVFELKDITEIYTGGSGGLVVHLRVEALYTINLLYSKMKIDVAGSSLDVNEEEFTVKRVYAMEKYLYLTQPSTLIHLEQNFTLFEETLEDCEELLLELDYCSIEYVSVVVGIENEQEGLLNAGGLLYRATLFITYQEKGLPSSTGSGGLVVESNLDLMGGVPIKYRVFSGSTIKEGEENTPFILNTDFTKANFTAPPSWRGFLFDSWIFETRKGTQNRVYNRSIEFASNKEISRIKALYYLYQSTLGIVALEGGKEVSIPLSFTTSFQPEEKVDYTPFTIVYRSLENSLFEAFIRVPVFIFDGKPLNLLDATLWETAGNVVLRSYAGRLRIDFLSKGSRIIARNYLKSGSAKLSYQGVKLSGLEVGLLSDDGRFILATVLSSDQGDVFLKVPEGLWRLVLSSDKRVKIVFSRLEVYVDGSPLTGCILEGAGSLKEYPSGYFTLFKVTVPNNSTSLLKLMYGVQEKAVIPQQWITGLHLYAGTLYIDVEPHSFRKSILAVFNNGASRQLPFTVDLKKPLTLPSLEDGLAGLVFSSSDTGQLDGFFYLLVNGTRLLKVYPSGLSIGVEATYNIASVQLRIIASYTNPLLQNRSLNANLLATVELGTEKIKSTMRRGVANVNIPLSKLHQVVREGGARIKVELNWPDGSPLPFAKDLPLIPIGIEIVQLAEEFVDFKVNALGASFHPPGNLTVVYGDVVFTEYLNATVYRVYVNLTSLLEGLKLIYLPMESRNVIYCPFPFEFRNLEKGEE